MKKTFEYSVTELNGLNENQRKVVAKAEEIMKRAYAPYSKFKVGAAVELDNGEIVVGNNQENAAYPSGLCAERVAIFSAKAQYPSHNIVRIALFTNRENEELSVSPCGSCRQSILEYEVEQRTPIEIIFQGEKDNFVIVKQVGDLLPFHFDKSRLH